MKSRIFIYTIALAACLCACQKEDELTPSGTPNSFAAPSGASDEEAKLREEFHKNTGCHLLFNDTLRHEYKGLDGNGNPYYETEMLGLEYVLTGVSYTRFKFDYVQTLEQKRQATDFLQNDLLPYIKDIMPYSLMVANRIDEYGLSMSEDAGGYEYVGSPLTYNNLRCLALNIGKLWELPTGERKSYAQEICCEMIFASWGGDPTLNYTDEKSKAKAFFEVSNYNYRAPKMSYNWMTGQFFYKNPLEYGFLEDLDADYFPDTKEDAVAYIKACLSMTEEEFFEKYGAADMYGYTRKKYDAIKPLLDETGIKFN